MIDIKYLDADMQQQAGGYAQRGHKVGDAQGAMLPPRECLKQGAWRPSRDQRSVPPKACSNDTP